MKIIEKYYKLLDHLYRKRVVDRLSNLLGELPKHFGNLDRARQKGCFKGFGRLAIHRVSVNRQQLLMSKN